MFFSFLFDLQRDPISSGATINIEIDISTKEGKAGGYTTQNNPKIPVYFRVFYLVIILSDFKANYFECLLRDISTRFLSLNRVFFLPEDKFSLKKFFLWSLKYPHLGRPYQIKLLPARSALCISLALPSFLNLNIFYEKLKENE